MQETYTAKLRQMSVCLGSFVMSSKLKKRITRGDIKGGDAKRPIRELENNSLL